MAIVVERLVTGGMETNTYIVHEDGASEAVLFDPAGDGEDILAFLEEKGLAVKLILLTHGHCDHIEALEKVRVATGAQVAVHELDAPLLIDESKNLSSWITPFRTEAADRTLKDGEVFGAAGMEITCVHTPGHTPGSACYLIGDVMLSGDTLFYGTIGRVDFPLSDRAAMMQSLKKLAAMERDYTVYPGHGRSTVLSSEQRNNSYLNGRLKAL